MTWDFEVEMDSTHFEIFSFFSGGKKEKEKEKEKEKTNEVQDLVLLDLDCNSSTFVEREWSSVNSNGESVRPFFLFLWGKR